MSILETTQSDALCAGVDELLVDPGIQRVVRILNSLCQDADGDKFWSVPLTFNADTMAQNSYNWNVWADEGGIVAMVVWKDQGRIQALVQTRSVRVIQARAERI